MASDTGSAGKILLWVLSTGPILDFQISEAREVADIDGHENQGVGMCDRSNLPIDIRCRTACILKAGSLARVPGGCNLVVWQNRKRCLDDVMQIVLQSSAAPAVRKPPASICELVPDG